MKLMHGAALAIGLTMQPAGMDRFLTTTGQLTARLDLRDEQQGFVGSTGEVLTIEPSGTWRLARFVNERVEPPHDRGRIPKEGLEALARALVRRRFAELSRRLGRRVEVNAHLVTLSFGDRDTTLVLDPGEPLGPASADAPGSRQAWDDFVGIVETVRGLVKTP